jgi:hypothetical protein
MPMHPGLQPHPLAPLIDVMFGQDPRTGLSEMVQRGLVADEQIERWLEALRKPEFVSDNGDLAVQAHLTLSPLIANHGKVSATAPLAVLAQLLPMLSASLSLGLASNAPARAHQHVLDLGAGIFYPLSTAALLYANGFERVDAFEPFAIHGSFAVAALQELVRAVNDDPERFRCFPDSPDARTLKARLAGLDQHRLSERIAHLNAAEVEAVNLGGVRLFQRAEALPLGALDWVFSNSVLEHVNPLPEALAWHRSLLKPAGFAFHTVDFVDHRYYFDRRLHPMQCYFDGVLDGINGLRPRQMEALFMSSGFQTYKVPKLALPAGMLDATQIKADPFSSLSTGSDLAEWVNGYILKAPN